MTASFTLLVEDFMYECKRRGITGEAQVVAALPNVGARELRDTLASGEASADFVVATLIAFTNVPFVDMFEVRA